MLTSAVNAETAPLVSNVGVFEKICELDNEIVAGTIWSNLFVMSFTVSAISFEEPLVCPSASAKLFCAGSGSFVESLLVSVTRLLISMVPVSSAPTGTAKDNVIVSLGEAEIPVSTPGPAVVNCKSV